MNIFDKKDTIKDIREGLKGIIWVGQLGFSLVTPPVLLSLLAWLMKRRLGVGSWIVFLAVVIGLLTGVSMAAGYYGDYKRKEAAAEKRPPGFSDRM